MPDRVERSPTGAVEETAEIPGGWKPRLHKRCPPLRTKKYGI